MGAARELFLLGSVGAVSSRLSPQEFVLALGQRLAKRSFSLKTRSESHQMAAKDSGHSPKTD